MDGMHRNKPRWTRRESDDMRLKYVINETCSALVGETHEQTLRRTIAQLRAEIEILRKENTELKERNELPCELTVTNTPVMVHPTVTCLHDRLIWDTSGLRCDICGIWFNNPPTLRECR